ncbi:helix-turn-helix domain-containing protein [Fervidibacillus albus]|uniref:Helix-turn-helix domain-containing protein n=1 Tax=Fervidibacillus albus TaxID=2980026 RepID=A0A9E8RTX3_9BACI|nr:helix-turn-helix transcriptional regulator [Fervidibacillus albus]WAA08580.1 helix-turn-helix domain-containing protein [Fervidibacillus albus]
MNFKNRFKDLREKKGITQKEMAVDLNIPRTSIANYEREGRLPRKERLKEIADYFGVSVDYLIGRTSQKTVEGYERHFPSKIKEMEFVDLIEKYKITIEGKEVTEDEMKAIIAFVQTYRVMRKQNL